MENNFISVNAVIDRLMRRPILEGLPEESAVDWAVDCIELIGSSKLKYDKVIKRDVSHFRTRLPTDCSGILDVRIILEDGVRVNMRKATDTFAIDYKDQTDRYVENSADFTYSVRNGLIYTSFEDGEIEISYSGLPVGENGDIMIPDNVNVIKAMESYISFMYITSLWEIGKIPDKVLNKAEVEYDWYIGKAQSSVNAMNIAERQTMSNMLTRLIDGNDDKASSYRNMGLPEYLRSHRS